MSQQFGSHPPSSSVEDSITLIDVGGAGGIDSKWHNFSGQLNPVLFEPNPEQAALLRETLKSQFPSAVVIEAALAHTNSKQDLNIAAYWGCSSIRPPNDRILSNYRIAPAFKVVKSESIQCQRYDQLYFNEQVPSPDAIKIDVQGFEYEVLQGFGGLLQNCLSIELETHIYPIYKDQKLMHDLVGFLADFDFVLRRITPIESFDSDIVEIDCWFTKNIKAWRAMDDQKKRKFGLICKACDLVDYSRIDPAAPHFQISPA